MTPSDVCARHRLDETTVVYVRPIRIDDGEKLVKFHEGLSPETVYRRYLGPHARLSRTEIERFTHVDYRDRLALVAELDGAIVAVGRYDRVAGTTDAEVAFVVADRFQHRGIGTVLLEELARWAWREGIRSFVATTLATNEEMLEVFTRSGFKTQTTASGSLIDVRFSIEPDEEYRAAVARRRGAGGRLPDPQWPPATEGGSRTASTSS